MQFHSEKKTWIDALEYCRENKSSLLEFTSQSVDCIKNLLSQNNSGSQAGAWIGLERSIFGNNPKWQWISGLQVNYSMRNSSFPVNSLNNHCGKIIVTEKQEIKWLDENCHKQLPFICQSKLPGGGGGGGGRGVDLFCFKISSFSITRFE